LDNQFIPQLLEFTRFDFLIAKDVIPVFYLLCAILLPFASWYFLLWAVRRYAVIMQFKSDSKYSIIFSLIMWIVRKMNFFKHKIEEKITWRSLGLEQKLKFIGLYFIIVAFSELFLRLVFEYLIAYIHMHEWMKPGIVS